MEKQLVGITEKEPIRPVDIWDDDPITGKPCDCSDCESLRKRDFERYKTFIKWYEKYIR